MEKNIWFFSLSKRSTSEGASFRFETKAGFFRIISPGHFVLKKKKSFPGDMTDEQLAVVESLLFPWRLFSLLVQSFQVD